MKTFMHKILIFPFLILVCMSMGHAQGYEIALNIKNLKDTTVILGHYLNQSMYPDDTARIDNNGHGVFSGSRKLPGGMYLVFLPSTKYFDIIMGDDQQFTITADTSDFISTLSFSGSLENELFLDFQRYMTDVRTRADELTDRLNVTQDAQEKENLGKALEELNNERTAKIKNLADDYPDLFVGTFLKATLDVSVPDPPRDENGAVVDSAWQYYYYRSHYFDNFDLSDPRLLFTPLYENKMMDFLSRVIPQIPDTIILETDKIIELAKSDSTLFRYVLVTLFNYYGKSNIMGMDAVQMHIAEKYYIPESWWSDPSFITDLKTRVEKTLPLLIGKNAPDIELMSISPDHFMAALQDTSLKRYPHVGTMINLYDIKAKYTVLIFWEADCGHCQVAVPELYDIYEKNFLNSDVKILAISTMFGEDGKVEWTDFVNEHHLYDWINAWNPYSYEYKVTYDILSTPQIFILDENKKIIAKKIGVEQVEEILDSLLHS